MGAVAICNEALQGHIVAGAAADGSLVGNRWSVFLAEAAVLAREDAGIVGVREVSLGATFAY